MPPWPSVAFFTFHNLGFLLLFLASIVRVFLRRPVWVDLCQKKKKFCFQFFLHAFPTSLGYLLRGVSCHVPLV